MAVSLRLDETRVSGSSCTEQEGLHSSLNKPVNRIRLQAPHRQDPELLMLHSFLLKGALPDAAT